MLNKKKITSRELLNAVSRSFAKSIPLLDRNKKAEVENQYLLLRFMDTIEDSKNHSLEHKSELLNRYFQILKSENDKGLTELITSVNNETIDEHDKLLVNHFREVFNKFMSFDDSVKDISMECLTEMGEGMLLFQTRKFKIGSELNHYCRSFQDLNKYCYYVAGTVGKYLTKLVKIRDGIDLDIQKALNFGRYLQKVNIIKDFLKDLEEMRHFWPTDLTPNTNPINLIVDPEARGQRLKILEKMITDAMKEFGPTFDYILSIPSKKRLRGYLAFCLVASLMATETLLEMWNNEDVFLNRRGVKISKLRFYQIYLFSKFGLYSRNRLMNYIDRIAASPLLA